MNGNFDSIWMAAKMERSLDLAKAERLGRLGWRPEMTLSWPAWLRRLPGRRADAAAGSRPARRLGDREEARATGL